MTCIATVLGMSSLVSCATLELFELPSHTYPDSLCNDGTHAGYYHDTDLSKLDKVHVHLNGGNLCDSDQTCLDRCDQNHDGQIDNHLCTASTKQTVQKDTGFFSSREDNPLHDFWHVMVPYCSSDTWAGTGHSDGTKLYFHGKNIFRNVMNSIAHHFNLFQAKVFVLSGSSAGGFGVGLNCDDVADWLHHTNPDMIVRCVADSPDFIPWWVHSEDCPRRDEDYQQFVNTYWKRDMDHSCQDFAFDPANDIEKPEEQCGILSQSLPFVRTDMFILVSLRDIAISRDYGCPQHGEEDVVIIPWMTGMHYLVTNATQTLPQIGWFVPSCPLHVLYSHDVLVPDIHTGERLSPNSALAKWMEGNTVHAVDNLDEENDTCP